MYKKSTAKKTQKTARKTSILDAKKEIK